LANSGASSKHIQVFPEAQLETVARIAAEAITGTQISNVLAHRGIRDRSGESTKWRRLYWIFRELQESSKAGNAVLGVIGELLAPARFLGKRAEFEECRRELNMALSLSGIQFGEDGKFRSVTSARTLTEAEQRAASLRSQFSSRSLHREVRRYCSSELLQDDYFHAVFEAAKGLLQRIRDISGLDTDGTKLLEVAFSTKHPLIAFNSLRTETERSQHLGFVSLLQGCVALARNPPAPTPRILSDTVEDAGDYLALISFLHRKLDSAIRTPLPSTRE
jgi:uncharacterized protein (TIGR02391 family)